ncbi:tRNA (guanine-N(7)-)-methyltransferase non-catalytic subunit trm82 [Fusarium oxysporum f. sp. albedinis]|nr:tRNA (guanine-N(7)-)-methyltransferase non-catalytic subunit trm82 [Fusarium oxysporum f. sp. albedinis]
MLSQLSTRYVFVSRFPESSDVSHSEVLFPGPKWALKMERLKKKPKKLQDLSTSLIVVANHISPRPESTKRSWISDGARFSVELK